MGRTGTDFITLTLHCVRTRPAGKEVRLRLDFFDARFNLSGSVVHFVPDTSYEGERRRETVPDGVPLLSTSSATDSQSGIAPLTLHSIFAGPIRSRGFSSSVAAAGFPRSLPSQDCLVSLNRSNPSASTPSLKPLPLARLPRPKIIAILLQFNHSCRSRKDRRLSLRPSYRPAPAAPVGLPAHSPEDRKNDADASPFPTSSESSGRVYARSNVSA